MAARFLSGDRAHGWTREGLRSCARAVAITGLLCDGLARGLIGRLSARRALLGLSGRRRGQRTRGSPVSQHPFTWAAVVCPSSRDDRVILRAVCSHKTSSPEQ